MAFAISFQSKKPGESSEQYDGRMEFAKAIERKIELGGGKVLSTGFDELFEVAPVKTAEMSSATSSPPDTEIKLALAARSTGFAALIADGHSRKVKYMQALALGLPCIAPKWITTCLDKQEIIDWSPYLLCAGVSAFLGDAIRSRNLLPYDAKSAKLCEVVQERPRLLEGSRILLVMKKSEENKKMAYIFLARVLGASLSRVYTPEEARAKLKASEDLGRPFDWVYVDEKLDKAELFLPGPSVAESKKRKRASSAAPTAPPSKRIRTLSDELVIQSLILGRLIEEDEQDE
ncbi:DNA repair protein crb2 [Pleurostoma richardsiae]|uniref:DNA repair protein crb2 n=1 Tax=Pleurostoma richardsiae TaxID=41990 RepID=A0AA38VNC9_9PEZI|nr:DNA repair protein crb2 [Pleurostoma richardsiae]